VTFGASLSIDGDPMPAEGMYVSGSYFPTLGVQAAVGRVLTPNDDEAIGQNFVVVLSHNFWQTRFGGDSSVTGKSIVVNGNAMRVIGVAARGFDGTTVGERPHIFVPMSMRGVLTRGFNGFENRRSYWIYVFGRLKPGGSIEAAETALNAIYRPIINDVEAQLQTGMSEQTLAQFREKRLRVEPGRRGQSDIHEEATPPLIMLGAVTLVVLLIACGNIANLLLARGASRAMEMGVRLALGANRRRLVGQLLTESLLLALLGGVLSLFVAKGTLAFIGSMLPPEAVATIHLSMHPSIVVFAAGLAVFTGLLFGVFPALHSTRSDLVSIIRANTGTISGGRAASRFRMTLVTAQIALSLTLLACSGLFLKSLMNVSRVDLGVDVDNVATFYIAPVRSGYDNARSAILFARVEEELAALPGVTGVASALVPLLGGSNWGTGVGVQGFQSGPDVDNHSLYNEVGPGYIAVTGMQLLAGREFTTADGAGGPRVAMVNESFARKFGLGTDAVGKLMSVGRTDSLNIQIVGLVRNAGYSEVKDSVPPVFFLPARQNSSIGAMNFFVRTAGDPKAVLLAIPPVLRRIEPIMPVEDLKTMPQQIRENVFLDRMISIFSASFAALATLLAAIGLYGVLSYTVATRTREIGVRMALGADGQRVQGLVMRQVALMTGIGGVIGVAAALALGIAARSMLFELQGHDPVVFASAIALIVLVALAAGFVPALRASRVDPIKALRYE
jgi:predicted permease